MKQATSLCLLWLPGESPKVAEPKRLLPSHAGRAGSGGRASGERLSLLVLSEIILCFRCFGYDGISFSCSIPWKRPTPLVTQPLSVDAQGYRILPAAKTVLKWNQHLHRILCLSFCLPTTCRLQGLSLEQGGWMLSAFPMNSSWHCWSPDFIQLRKVVSLSCLFRKVMISDSLNVPLQQLPTRHLLPPQRLFADSFRHSLSCPKGKELLKK